MAAAEQERPETENSPEPTGPPANEPPGTAPPLAAEGGGPSAPPPSPAPSPSRWWVAVAALAAAAVLLVLAVFPPWPDGWVAGEFGGLPWWVATPALLGVAVLVGGLGGRRVAWGAAGAALLTAGLAVLVVLRDPSKDPAENPGWREFLEPRPVAPTAAVLAAVVAAGLCVLVARRGARLPPTRSGDGTGGRRAWVRRLLLAGDGPRVRGQRVLVVTLVGALVGTSLSAGAGVGADRVQRAFLDEAPFEAASETVPRGEREDGHDVSQAEHNEPSTDLGLGEVAWQETLPGPAELTTCVLRQPQAREDGWVPEENRRQPLVTRSTLVTVEETPGGDAVVGYDPVDGGERWRYTVQDGEVELPDPDYDEDGTVTVPSRIGQVGVTDFCAVHVVVDPVSLVTLDAASGEVAGESLLPSMTSGAWTDDEETREDHWRFVTDSRPDDHRDQEDHQAWDRLVPLGGGWEVHLEAGGQLAEMDRTTGEPRALSETESECRHLVAYEQRNTPRFPGDATVLTENCRAPSHQTVPWLPGDSSDPHDGLSRLLSDSHDVPLFGCEDEWGHWPDLTDLRSHGDRLVLAGEWCDAFDGPLLVVVDSLWDDPEYEVVELPEGTELPLRPHHTRVDRSLVWLDRGTVYHYGIGDRDEVGHQEMYAGADGVEAMVPPEHDADEFLASDAQRVFYAVTESGSVLKLVYGEEFDEPESLASEVVEELDGVAGTCDGRRDLVLDRPGLTLLALCETEDGTEVTAVSGERLTDADSDFGGTAHTSRGQY